jgi:hypothetical protein
MFYDWENPVHFFKLIILDMKGIHFNISQSQIFGFMGSKVWILKPELQLYNPVIFADKSLAWQEDLVVHWMRRNRKYGGKH